MQKCMLASREAEKLTVAARLYNGFLKMEATWLIMTTEALFCEHYFIVVDMELFKIILTFVINIMKTCDEN